MARYYRKPEGVPIMVRTAVHNRAVASLGQHHSLERLGFLKGFLIDVYIYAHHTCITFELVPSPISKFLAILLSPHIFVTAGYRAWAARIATTMLPRKYGNYHKVELFCKVDMHNVIRVIRDEYGRSTSSDLRRLMKKLK